MIQPFIFLSFTGIALLALLAASYFKKVNFKSLVGLFLFGILISIPFIMVEYMRGTLKYYFVILAFIAIELGILYAERKIKYFHDLIHHNIQELRLLSFFLIGLGFTFSEISFTIFHFHGASQELMTILPFKTIFSLLIHTVLTSAASLMRIGNLFAETIYETVFKLISYYSRIAVISLSHYLYIFSIEHNVILVSMILFMAVIAFFLVKKHLDRRLQLTT